MLTSILQSSKLKYQFISSSTGKKRGGWGDEYFYPRAKTPPKYPFCQIPALINYITPCYRCYSDPKQTSHCVWAMNQCYEEENLQIHEDKSTYIFSGVVLRVGSSTATCSRSRAAVIITNEDNMTLERGSFVSLSTIINLAHLGYMVNWQPHAPQSGINCVF